MNIDVYHKDGEVVGVVSWDRALSEGEVCTQYVKEAEEEDRCWHHLVVSYVAGVIKCFVDGGLI